MIDKEALQLLLYAQKFYPKDYVNFVGSLAKKEIPWDFANDDFTGLLDGFKQQFSSMLASQEPLLDTAVVLEQNVPMKDVVEPLIADLEQAEAAQKEGRGFISNNKKIKTYIEQSKKHIKESETVASLIQNAQERIQTNSSFDLPTNSQGLPEIPNAFFSLVAQTPLQKILAPALDLFANTNTKLAIIYSAIDRAREEIQKRTDAAGELLAGSPEIIQIIKRMNASSFQVPQTTFSPLHRLQNFAADAFFTVFFKPELAAINMALYQGIPLQTTVRQLSAHALYIRGAARFALQKAGEKVVASTGLGAWIGTVIGGPLGTFIGGVVGGALMSKIKSGVSGFFNFLSLQSLTNLLSGNTETTSVWKDSSFVIAIVLVVFVALVAGVVPIVGSLGLVPSGQQTQLVDDNALIQALGSGPAVEGARYGKTAFVCSLSLLPGLTIDELPTSSITTCPVHATITQRPNDTFSHKGTNAFDFGAGVGSSIAASHDGIVLQYVDSVPDGHYERTYGNMVVLIAKDQRGAVFCTNYAHLSQNFPLETVSSYNNRAVISAGSIIAYSDTSGNTFDSSGNAGNGPHLHFESSQTQEIILPDGCP